MKLSEQKVVSAILASSLQVPGLATFGPRLVSTSDANHPACEMRVVTNDQGQDYLDVKYKGKTMAIPMSFVALVEYK